MACAKQHDDAYVYHALREDFNMYINVLSIQCL